MGQTGHDGGAPELAVYHQGESTAAEGELFLIGLPRLPDAVQLPVYGSQQGGVAAVADRGIFAVHPPGVGQSRTGKEGLVHDQIVQHDADGDGLRLSLTGFPEHGAQGIGVLQVKEGKTQVRLLLLQGFVEFLGIHNECWAPFVACMFGWDGSPGKKPRRGGRLAGAGPYFSS